MGATETGGVVAGVVATELELPVEADGVAAGVAVVAGVPPVGVVELEWLTLVAAKPTTNPPMPRTERAPVAAVAARMLRRPRSRLASASACFCFVVFDMYSFGDGWDVSLWWQPSL